MKEELIKTTFLFVGFLIGKWIKSCDGDEYIVKFQLQHYIPVTKIATRYYRFCSKDEVDTIFELTKELDYKSVVDYFFKCGNWVTAFQGFVEQGDVLNTPKGFYRKVIL